MAAMTLYLRNKLMDHITHGVAYIPPTNLWLGLFITATDETGAGTEVTGGGYLRRLLTFTATVGGIEYNAVDIFFPTATLPWNTVSYIGIYDNNVAGNMLFFGKLNIPVFINAGNTFHINSGIIQLALK